MENCPICNEPIKGGIFSSKQWAAKSKVDLINTMKNTNYEHICFECAANLTPESYEALIAELKFLKNKISETSDDFIISTCNPDVSLHYTLKGLVTATITVGTSAITEVATTVTDLIGGESERYKALIEKAQTECLNRLKVSAVELGGNGIAGLKIQYTEVGGMKSMVMINMYGTAIVTQNDQVNVGDFTQMKERYDYLVTIKDLVNKVNY